MENEEYMYDLTSDNNNNLSLTNNNLTLDQLDFNKPDKNNKVTSSTCEITAPPGFSYEDVYNLLEKQTLPKGVSLYKDEKMKSCYLQRKACVNRTWLKVENRIKQRNQNKGLTLELLTFKKPDKPSGKKSKTCEITADPYTYEEVFNFLNEQQNSLPVSVTLHKDEETQSCYLKRRSERGYAAWETVEHKIKDAPPPELTLNLLKFAKPPKARKEKSLTCKIEAYPYTYEEVYNLLEKQTLPKGVSLHKDEKKKSCYLQRSEELSDCAYETWLRTEKAIKDVTSPAKRKSKSKRKSESKEISNNNDHIKRIKKENTSKTKNLSESSESEVEADKLNSNQLSYFTPNKDETNQNSHLIASGQTQSSQNFDNQQKELDNRNEIILSNNGNESKQVQTISDQPSALDVEFDPDSFLASDNILSQNGIKINQENQFIFTQQSQTSNILFGHKTSNNAAKTYYTDSSDNLEKNKKPNEKIKGFLDERDEYEENENGPEL